MVSFTAEPTPARDSGNDPMIDSVAGLMVSAIPVAASAIRQAMSGNGVVAPTLANATSPPATHARPAPTVSLVPIRSTIRGLIGEMTIIGIANARSRTPVERGE